jgi:hypothetical protein
MEDGGTAKDRLLERLNNFLQDQEDSSAVFTSTSAPISPRQQPLEQQCDDIGTSQAQVVVSNFDTAFQDGSIFYLMVKKHRPDLLPSDSAAMPLRELLERMFGLLKSVWGVPQLISISELVDSKPDDKSIIRRTVPGCVFAYGLRSHASRGSGEAVQEGARLASARQPRGRKRPRPNGQRDD